MGDGRKKAVVIGGSNGIGLAICKRLVSRGYFVEIGDRVEPEIGILDGRDYRYRACDLLNFGDDFMATLAADPDVDVLMVTAGIGRIADFQFYHTAEIEKMLTIDTVSTIKIFRIFYDRILGTTPFYSGVMGSIAGWLSTPSASVYAAAKAAVVRFVESVNIELEAYNSPNRILDISPATFKGSKFYGKKNDLSLTEPFAEEILQRLFNRETRFIPQYEEFFKSVFTRYHDDPHAYGMYSWQYKKDSGRVDNQKRVVIGYLSGTFDLFHVGHLNLIRRAKAQCDYLIVGVHPSGAWKGKETFIPFEERMQIIAACKYVDKAVEAFDEDSDAWNEWHFDKLFVGSDYQKSERFKRYEAYFKDKGVEIVYFPYTQTTSSTQIRKTVMLRIQETGVPGKTNKN